MNRNYDAVFGGQELYGIVYCEDNIWLDRGEYDGSEWWQTHKYPDLRVNFDEIDVLRYERSKKLSKISKQDDNI